MNKKIPPLYSWTFLITLLVLSVFLFTQRNLIKDATISFVPEISINVYGVKENIISFPVERTENKFGSDFLKPDGAIIYLSEEFNTIFVMNKKGQEKRELIWSLDKSYRMGNLDWSPDGKKVAFFAQKNAYDRYESLYIYDGDTNIIYKACEDIFIDGPLAGEWSPDSKYYAYFKLYEKNKSRLYVFDVENLSASRIIFDKTDYIKGDLQWDKLNNLYLLASSYRPFSSDYRGDLKPKNGDIDVILSINAKDKVFKRVLVKELGPESGEVEGFIINRKTEDLFYRLSFFDKPSEIYRINLKTSWLEKTRHTFSLDGADLSSDEEKFIWVMIKDDNVYNQRVHLVNFKDLYSSSVLDNENTEIEADFYAVEYKDDIWWDENKIIVRTKDQFDIHILDLENFTAERIPFKAPSSQIYIRPPLVVKKDEEKAREVEKGYPYIDQMIGNPVIISESKVIGYERIRVKDSKGKNLQDIRAEDCDRLSELSY